MNLASRSILVGLSCLLAPYSLQSLANLDQVCGTIITRSEKPLCNVTPEDIARLQDIRNQLADVYVTACLPAQHHQGGRTHNLAIHHEQDRKIRTRSEHAVAIVKNIRASIWFINQGIRNRKAYLEKRKFLKDSAWSIKRMHERFAGTRPQKTT